ncbi:putative peptidyl-tRNA hydrolase PTRHD1 [Hippopotamus amphibius kiboko]|uniref:putative peptidyl-tRNA hydrolase PTRHD1 n=1 Tax=Hippopotamus amphibius kiboko TaxID=575201 RepID=UPI0025937332|nr:putative peptidyl-tRNA hydrolase PTRHD1 [Hippopotamus amphibius kiboko]
MASFGTELQFLVRYLVSQRDLWIYRRLSSPGAVGAFVAQAWHTSCNHLHAAAYRWEQEHMRKVVLTAPEETALKKPAETLRFLMLWLEQPKNISTCIRLRPYPKEEVTGI